MNLFRRLSIPRMFSRYIGVQHVEGEEERQNDTNRAKRRCQNYSERERESAVPVLKEVEVKKETETNLKRWVSIPKREKEAVSVTGRRVTCQCGSGRFIWLWIVGEGSGGNGWVMSDRELCEYNGCLATVAMATVRRPLKQRAAATSCQQSASSICRNDWNSGRQTNIGIRVPTLQQNSFRGDAD